MYCKLVKSAPRQAPCLVVSQQTPRRRPPRVVAYRCQVSEECAKPGTVYVVSQRTPCKRQSGTMLTCEGYAKGGALYGGVSADTK